MAKPVLEADSHAKEKLRQTIWGRGRSKVGCWLNTARNLA